MGPDVGNYPTFADIEVANIIVLLFGGHGYFETPIEAAFDVSDTIVVLVRTAVRGALKHSC